MSGVSAAIATLPTVLLSFLALVIQSFPHAVFPASARIPQTSAPLPDASSVAGSLTDNEAVHAAMRTALANGRFLAAHTAVLLMHSRAASAPQGLLQDSARYHYALMTARERLAGGQWQLALDTPHGDSRAAVVV